MPDKVQLIKEEIERRIENLEFSLENNCVTEDSRLDIRGNITTLKSLLQFINSIPEESKCIYNRTFEERKETCKYCSAACSVRIEEEPASKDLEEEIDEEIDNLCELGCYMEDLAKGNSEGVYPLPDNVVKELRKFARHFAEWGRKQMMKDAVDGQVVYQIGSAEIAPTDIRYKVVSDRVYIPNVKLGDKVKIIVIKED